VKLANPFTMPETEPVVPERLAEKITNLLPHTTKIIITQHSVGGSRVVNTVYLDGNEEAPEVYTIVKAAADYHASEEGRGGKYRAQIWRYVPGKSDAERHAVTFHVRLDEDEDAPEAVEQERRAVSSGWSELFDGVMRFAELAAGYGHRSTERILEQSRQDAERLHPMSDMFHDVMGLYRDGLRMKAESVQAIAEVQLREREAVAQANENSKMWEVFGPAVQVATMHAGQRLFGAGPQKALPPGHAPQAPAARRREVPSTATPAAPTTPPVEAPRSTPPEARTQAEPPAQAPTTLHELAAALLDSMGASALVRLGRLLDDDQAGYLAAIAAARDDDSSAEAIAGLMHSLMTNPSKLMDVQQALSLDQIGALKQIGMLARRHLEERHAQRTEGAPPSSGDAPSAGKVGSGA